MSIYSIFKLVDCWWVYYSIWSVSGLFVPLHFRSRGAKSPRTFVPWNFSTPGIFAPQQRMFQELLLHGTFAPVEPSLHKQLLCPLSFINTGVSVRIKVQPINIDCCSVLPHPTHCCYYGDSRVRLSCEATLISDNCIPLRLSATLTAEKFINQCTRLVITREAMVDR